MDIPVIRRYLSHYTPRLNNPEAGGGRALIVKETIDHSVIKDLDKNLDHIGVRITTDDFCFNLISLYAPSNLLKSETFEKYNKYGSDLFILGEFELKKPRL